MKEGRNVESELGIYQHQIALVSARKLRSSDNTGRRRPPDTYNTYSVSKYGSSTHPSVDEHFGNWPVIRYFAYMVP